MVGGVHMLGDAEVVFLVALGVNQFAYHKTSCQTYV